MRDTPAKVDGSTTLPAGTFNQLNSELENIVTSADFTLDPEGGPDTNLFMLAETAAAYAGAGWFYTDSGTASAYVLSISTNLKAMDAYLDGMTVAFKAGNSSTGASTINVNSIGVKDLKNPDGTALDSTSIIAGNIVLARYDSGNNRFELLNANLFATTAETEARTRTDKGITPAGLGATGQTGTIDIWPTGAASVPSGFLECDGTGYSTTTYAALFAVIGYTFGGSGGTFNVPNITSPGANLDYIIKT